MPFAATWIDLEIIILSEVNKRKISHRTTYMWSLKKWYKWTYLQNENRYIAKTNLGLPKAKEGRGKN